MKPWTAPENILAPLIIGADPDLADVADVVFALDAAMACVPAVRAVFSRTTAGISHHKREGHLGLLQITGEPAAPYVRRCRLVVGTEGQNPAQAAESWWWEMALFMPKNGLLSPAIPEDRTGAVLQATQLTASGNTVRGLPLMALLRHLWIDALRNRDPELIVLGGQSEWKPEWDRLLQAPALPTPAA